MTSWLLKALVQGAISPLPRHDRPNRLLQRYVTGSATVTEGMFETKAAQCRRHLDAYRAWHGTDATPQTALELGTGRAPIVPIGLALAGVRSVVTLDIHPLLEPDDTHTTIELYAQRLRAGTLKPLLASVDPERARKLLAAAQSPGSRDPAACLRQLGVRALTGALPALGLPKRSVNLLVSNNTLEHIQPHVLRELLIELRRLAAPGAVMSHFIDMSDHYAHFDPGISEFNYMRYRDRAWQFANNPLHYQNRLRVSDYRRLIQDARFQLVCEDSERGSPRELARIRLAPRFRRYTDEDLLTLRSWITAIARDTP
ncbi:MAG: class I SAM-dependent methyltransferase [Solirubrobacteraceae bacterium]